MTVSENSESMDNMVNNICTQTLSTACQIKLIDMLIARKLLILDGKTLHVCYECASLIACDTLPADAYGRDPDSEYCEFCDCPICPSCVPKLAVSNKNFGSISAYGEGTDGVYCSGCTSKVEEMLDKYKKPAKLQCRCDERCPCDKHECRTHCPYGQIYYCKYLCSCGTHNCAVQCIKCGDHSCDNYCPCGAHNCPNDCEYGDHSCPIKGSPLCSSTHHYWNENLQCFEKRQYNIKPLESI